MCVWPPSQEVEGLLFEKEGVVSGSGSAPGSEIDEEKEGRTC